MNAPMAGLIQRDVLPAGSHNTERNIQSHKQWCDFFVLFCFLSGTSTLVLTLAQVNQVKRG